MLMYFYFDQACNACTGKLCVNFVLAYNIQNVSLDSHYPIDGYSSVDILLCEQKCELLSVLMHAYGITPSTLHLLADYLSQRYQRVKVSSTTSKWKLLNKGPVM